MYEIWGMRPAEGIGWLKLEEIRFEEQARWRCEELAAFGYRTAMRDAATGETVFNPLPRRW